MSVTIALAIIIAAGVIAAVVVVEGLQWIRRRGRGGDPS